MAEAYDPAADFDLEEAASPTPFTAPRRGAAAAAAAQPDVAGPGGPPTAALMPAGGSAAGIELSGRPGAGGGGGARQPRSSLPRTLAGGTDSSSDAAAAVAACGSGDDDDIRRAHTTIFKDIHSAGLRATPPPKARGRRAAPIAPAGGGGGGDGAHWDGSTSYYDDGGDAHAPVPPSAPLPGGRQHGHLLSGALSRIAASPALSILTRHQRSRQQQQRSLPAVSAAAATTAAAAGARPVGALGFTVRGQGVVAAMSAPPLPSAPSPLLPHRPAAPEDDRQRLRGRSSSFAGAPEPLAPLASYSYSAAAAAATVSAASGAAGGQRAAGAGRPVSSLWDATAAASLPPRSFEMEDALPGGGGITGNPLMLQLQQQRGEVSGGSMEGLPGGRERPSPPSAPSLTTGYSFTVDTNATELIASRFAHFGRENVAARERARRQLQVQTLQQPPPPQQQQQ